MCQPRHAIFRKNIHLRNTPEDYSKGLLQMFMTKVYYKGLLQRSTRGKVCLPGKSKVCLSGKSIGGAPLRQLSLEISPIPWSRGLSPQLRQITKLLSCQAEVIAELRDEGKTDADTVDCRRYGLDASHLHKHGHGDRDRRKVESPNQHTLQHNRTFCQHARTAGTEVHDRSSNETSFLSRSPASC